MHTASLSLVERNRKRMALPEISVQRKSTLISMPWCLKSGIDPRRSRLSVASPPRFAGMTTCDGSSIQAEV